MVVNVMYNYVINFIKVSNSMNFRSKSTTEEHVVSKRKKL